MGGKSSKAEGLLRSSSFRKSQRTTLQRIERKLNKISKDIEKFKGTIDDNQYTKIKQNITEVIDDLEKINTTVKDKYKDAYQGILDRCNDELQKLDAKVTSSPSLSPATSPTPISPANLPPRVETPLPEASPHNVQVKLVKIALEQDRASKEKARSKAADDIKKEVDLEQDTVDKIDAMRKKIEYLETEIHIYKTDPDEKLYGFIRENLSQIIIKLDTLETFGNIQIKHERKLALQRAQECLKYLMDGSPDEEGQAAVEVELHETRNDKERLSSRSTYRPITLDLNISEKLNEELHNVIHKRMEEATRENEKPIEVEKLTKTEKSADASTDDSFERFDNPDSEDEFDIVNAEDKEDAKNVPVLVTSF